MQSSKHVVVWQMPQYSEPAYTNGFRSEFVLYKRHGGVTHDSTNVVAWSGNLHVPIFSPQGTPAVLDQPVVFRFATKSGRQCCMVHLGRVAVPVVVDAWNYRCYVYICKNIKQQNAWLTFAITVTKVDATLYPFLNFICSINIYIYI